MAGQSENHVGTYSVFLQHIPQPLIWLVCMDHQLPEEVFKMMNFVAALILVDLSSKQQISLLPVILAPHDEDQGRILSAKKVVTNFCKTDTIHIKVIALIFVVIIIIANVAILFCFEILVVTS